MHQLNNVDLTQISGAGIKNDILAGGLLVGAITTVGNGMATIAAGTVAGSTTTIKVGMALAAIGFAELSIVAASEMTGLTDLYGWYQFGKDLKYYKDLVTWSSN